MLLILFLYLRPKIFVRNCLFVFCKSFRRQQPQQKHLLNIMSTYLTVQDTNEINVPKCFNNPLLNSNLQHNKILVIGPSGVGKTTLIRTFQGHHHNNSAQYVPTCGSMLISLDVPFNDFTLQLEIWDNSGHSGAIGTVRLNYFHTKVVIAVYDRTDMGSFGQMKCQLEDFLSWPGIDRSKVAIFIVATIRITDLQLPLEPMPNEVLDYVQMIDGNLFQLYAIDRCGVNTLFEQVLRHIYRQLLDEDELLQSYDILPNRLASQSSLPDFDCPLPSVTLWFKFKLFIRRMLFKLTKLV